MIEQAGSAYASRRTSRTIRVTAMLLVALISASVLSVVATSNSGATASAENASLSMAMQDDAATPVAATPVVQDDCEGLAPGVGSEPWVRAELYFGTTMPDGSEITDEAWQEFLDEEITPRFPDGLTVLEGYGQFLNSQGVIAAEESIVLIIFYPLDAATESSENLEEIRDAYETQFDQESVLRADSAPVCISF